MGNSALQIRNADELGLFNSRILFVSDVRATWILPRGIPELLLFLFLM